MKKLIYIFIAIVAFSSCQKDVDIDLNANNPSIVIEGIYTAEDSTVSVRITKTVNYFGSDPVPEINNATVTITDHNGVSQSVPFIISGNYVLTNYVPEYNTIYTLNVVAGGTSYTAQCKMASPVQLEVPTYSWFPGGFGLDPGFIMDMSFLDPADTVNFYAAVLTVNGEELNRLDEITTQDDVITDGNNLTRPLFGVAQIDSFDVVGLELRSIDEVIYDYINEAAGIVGGSSSAAPGNPTTNWDNGALGYFSAYSNSRQEVVIL